MDRGIISISETGVITIPTAPIWMTKFEIADLFGVFSCNVRKAKSSTVNPTSKGCLLTATVPLTDRRQPDFLEGAQFAV